MNKDHLDHRLEKALSRMSRTKKATLYVELLFRLMWYRLRRMVYFASPRARNHWLGHHNRPRRLERPLLFMIIAVAPITLEIHQYLFWLSFWSGAAVLFISFNAVLRRVPRKHYRWVR